MKLLEVKEFSYCIEIYSYAVVVNGLIYIYGYAVVMYYFGRHIFL